MISFVVFLNNDNNSNKIFQQIDKNLKHSSEHEIIFVLTKNYSYFDEIIKLQNKYDDLVVKFIFLTKETSFNKKLLKIMNLITGYYVMFLSSNCNIDSKTITLLEKTLSDNSKIDILETGFSIEEFWKPKNRLKIDLIKKVIEIKSNPSVIAFAFPFIFNKVILAKVIDDVINKYIKSNMTNLNDDSIFSFCSFQYLIFLEAKRYMYVPNQMVNYTITDNEILVQKYYESIWNIVQNIYKVDERYKEEIIYAKWFYFNIYLCSLYAWNKSHIDSKLAKIKSIINKHSLLEKKLYDRLMKFKSSEYAHFNLNNKYMVSSYNENEKKLMKEVHSISKWNKLLKGIE